MSSSREPWLHHGEAKWNISVPEANSTGVPGFPRIRSKQKSARPGSTKAEATPYAYLEFHSPSPEAEEVHAPSEVTEGKKAAPAGRFPDGEAKLQQSHHTVRMRCFHVTQPTEPRAPRLPRTRASTSQ